MTLKCRLFILMLLGSCFLKAQSTDTMTSFFYHEGLGLSYRYPSQGAISIQSTALVFGNSLTRNVLSEALGGSLSRTAVEDMLRVHDQPNTRWGLEHQSKMTYHLPYKPEKKIRQHLLFGLHHLFELKASEDFIGATLKGNANLKGKEIYSNPLSWRMITWNRLGWGFGMQKNSANGLVRGTLTASLLHGGNATSGLFSSASIYTAEDISELRVSATGNVLEYPQKSMKHGWGLAVDAGMLFQKGQHLFEANLSNLGVLNYGNQTLEHTWDTTMVFKGVVWDRDRRAAVLPGWVSDSFVNHTSIVSGEGSSWMPLPSDVLIRWSWNMNQVHELGLMARARWSDVYVPQIAGIHRIHLSKKFLLMHELGYGGYRDFFWDAEIALELVKSLEFGARFMGLNSLISPQSRGGFGISARLVWVPGKTNPQ